MSKTLGWVIGIFSVLLLAVGGYFLYSWMKEKEKTQAVNGGAKPKPLNTVPAGAASTAASVAVAQATAAENISTVRRYAL